ncbi:unnamed protein product, partial [Protopolystoma xenopodis]
DLATGKDANVTPNCPHNRLPATFGGFIRGVSSTHALSTRSHSILLDRVNPEPKESFSRVSSVKSAMAVAPNQDISPSHLPKVCRVLLSSGREFLSQCYEEPNKGLNSSKIRRKRREVLERKRGDVTEQTLRRKVTGESVQTHLVPNQKNLTIRATVASGKAAKMVSSL